MFHVSKCGDCNKLRIIGRTLPECKGDIDKLTQILLWPLMTPGLCPANERRRCNVTSSLIGWTPCPEWQPFICGQNLFTVLLSRFRLWSHKPFMIWILDHCTQSMLWPIFNKHAFIYTDRANNLIIVPVLVSVILTCELPAPMYDIFNTYIGITT